MGWGNPFSFTLRLVRCCSAFGKPLQIYKKYKKIIKKHITGCSMYNIPHSLRRSKTLSWFVSGSPFKIFRRSSVSITVWFAPVLS